MSSSEVAGPDDLITLKPSRGLFAPAYTIREKRIAFSELPVSDENAAIQASVSAPKPGHVYGNGSATNLVEERKIARRQ